MQRTTLLLLCFITLNVFSQTGEGNYKFRLATRKVLSHNSDAGFYTIKLNTKLFNIFLNKGRKGIISSALNYSYSRINFEEQALQFDHLNNFHNIDLNLSYIRRINKKWSIYASFSPQIKSNLASKIVSDDLYIQTFVIFTISKKQDRRFSFGLAYMTTLGIPAPIPIFMYWVNLNIKWKITLGFPRINFEYDLNNKSSVSFFAEMEGINSNLTKDITHPNFIENRLGQKLSYSDIITGLEYSFHMKTYSVKINCGYAFIRNFKLQNSDYKTAYQYNLKNNLNIGMSIGFNL